MEKLNFFKNLQKILKVRGIAYTAKYVLKIIKFYRTCNPFYFEKDTLILFRILLKVRRISFILKIKLAQFGFIPLSSVLYIYPTRVNRLNIDFTTVTLFGYSWNMPRTQSGVELDVYLYELIYGLKIFLYIIESLLVLSILPILTGVVYFRRNLEMYISVLYIFLINKVFGFMVFLTNFYSAYVLLKFRKIILLEKTVALKMLSAGKSEFYDFGFNAGKAYLKLYLLGFIVLIFSWTFGPFLEMIRFIRYYFLKLFELAFFYIRNLFFSLIIIFNYFAIGFKKYLIILRHKVYLVNFIYFFNFFRKLYYPILYPYFVNYSAFSNFIFLNIFKYFFMFLPLIYVFASVLASTAYIGDFDFVWVADKVVRYRSIVWVNFTGMQLTDWFFYAYAPIWFFYTLGIKGALLAQFSPIHLVAFLILYYTVIFYLFDYNFNSTHSTNIFFENLTNVDFDKRYRSIISSISSHDFFEVDKTFNEPSTPLQKLLVDQVTFNFEERVSIYLDLAYTNQNLLIKVEGLENYYHTFAYYLSPFSVTYPYTAFTFTALDTEQTVEESYFGLYSPLLISDLAFDEIEEFDMFNNYLVDYDQNEEFDTVDKWFRFGEEAMDDEPDYHIPDHLDHKEFSCFPEQYYDESLYDLTLFTVRNFLLPYYYYYALYPAKGRRYLRYKKKLKQVSRLVIESERMATGRDIERLGDEDLSYANMYSLPQRNMRYFVKRDILSEGIFALVDFNIHDTLLFYNYEFKLSPLEDEDFTDKLDITGDELDDMDLIPFSKLAYDNDPIPDYVRSSTLHLFFEILISDESNDEDLIDSMWELVDKIGYDPFYGFYEFLELDDEPRDAFELRITQNLEYFPELDEYPVERHLPLHMYNMDFFEFDVDAPTNDVHYPEADISDMSNLSFVRRLSDPTSYKWSYDSLAEEFSFQPTFLQVSQEYAKTFVSAGLGRYVNIVRATIPEHYQTLNIRNIDNFAYMSYSDVNSFMFSNVLNFTENNFPNWSQSQFKAMYGQFLEVVNLENDTFPYFASDNLLLEMEDFRDAAVSNIHPFYDFNQVKFISKKDLESDFQFTLDNDGFDTFTFNAENEEVGTEFQFSDPFTFRQLLEMSATWYRHTFTYLLFLFMTLTSTFKWLLPFQNAWFGKTLNLQTKQLFDRAHVLNKKSIFFGEKTQSLWFKADGIHDVHYMQVKPKFLRDAKFRNNYYNYSLGDGFRPIDEWLKLPKKLPMATTAWLQFRIEYLIIFAICYFLLELALDFLIVKFDDYKKIKLINKVYAKPSLYKSPLKPSKYILWSHTSPYYAVFLKRFKLVKSPAARFGDSESKYLELFFAYSGRNIYRTRGHTFTRKSPILRKMDFRKDINFFGYNFAEKSISMERSYLDFHDTDLAILPDSEYYEVNLPGDYLNFYRDVSRFEIFPYYYSLDFSNFIIFDFSPIKYLSRVSTFTRDYFGILPISWENFFLGYYFDLHLHERKYFKLLVYKLTVLREWRKTWYNLQVSRGFFYFDLPLGYFIYPYFSIFRFYEVYRAQVAGRSLTSYVRTVPQQLNIKTIAPFGLFPYALKKKEFYIPSELEQQQRNIKFDPRASLRLRIREDWLKQDNPKKYKEYKRKKTIRSLKSKLKPPIRTEYGYYEPNTNVHIGILDHYMEKGYLNCYNQELFYFKDLVYSLGFNDKVLRDLKQIMLYDFVFLHDEDQWLRFYPYLSVYSFYGYNKVNGKFFMLPHGNIAKTENILWEIVHTRFMTRYDDN